jgi:nucleoside-diphosphate-sugar epimerase
MDSDIQKVALFGAAGAVGHAVAPELAKRGIPFRAVGRNRARLEQAFGALPQAEVFDADLSDLRSAGAAARGVDTIIYCVGLPYPVHYQHPVLMRTTLEAATAMQVKRLVLMSSVYAYGVPRASRVAETHPREPRTTKGAYRKEQEDLVLEAHKNGKLAGMVIRLPDFYGPHADIGLANPVFRAALAGKTANWIGPVNTAHEFIYMPDSGPVVVDLATRPECYGESWNLGGVGEINTMDFITRIFQAVGRSPKYRSGGRAMLKFIGRFSPTIREAVEMVYLQETPVILDDSKLKAKLGAIHKTSYDEGIQQTLAWMKATPTAPK